MTVNIETKNGIINVEDDVIASIVGGAASKSAGVVGMVSKSAFRDGVNQVLNQANYGKGIVVQEGDAGLIVDVYIVVRDGTKFSEVSKSVQKRVIYDLKQALDVPTQAINVIVAGVIN